jgi:Flp pilus assembly protein TadD
MTWLPAIFDTFGRRRNPTRADVSRAAPRAGTHQRRTAKPATCIMFAILAACALLAPAAQAHAKSEQRIKSDRVVADAEKLVNEAGKANPVDSAKVRKAVGLLNEALAIDPRNDSAYVDLGFCYGLLRDAATAVQMYTKATQVNPSGPNFKELADIYLRTGDAESALMAANAGIIKDPRNASLYNAKGMALNDLMRFKEAIVAFKKALKLDPHFTVASDNLRALTGKMAAPSRAAHAGEPAPR